MWQQNRHLDTEIEATPMPDELRDRKVMVLCNDCEQKSWCNFHVLGAKCTICHSYNTRQL